MSVFGKTTFHIRPLLRNATSGTLPPDFFTSNTNPLRHHLPLYGGKTNLVAQNSNLPNGSYTSPSGNTGSAGYNGGAGAGSGGYTGHARAFLSFSQSSIDPSASLIDEQKKQNELAAQRSLLPQHRMSKRAQLIQLDQASPGRQVRAQIEGRKGSRRVSVVQIEDGEAEGEGRGRRTIAYGLPEGEVDASQLGNGGGARQIGGARTMSTDARSRASSPARRRAVAGSLSDLRVIGQPNRVLMDLAGVDVPLGAGSRVGGIRRNSTAAVERPSLDSPPDALLFATPGEQGEAGEAAEDARRTSAIIEAIDQAVADGNPEALASLVDHYRSPRGPHAQDITGLSAVLPLPSGYSLEGFNACLKAVLASRKKNGTVAPILEMYNALLSHGLLPDSVTYECVMRALIRREVEVRDAVRSWEEQKKWGRWRMSLLKDKSWDTYLEAQRDDLMEQYRREGSLPNAIKLLRAAAGMELSGQFPDTFYHELLGGMIAPGQKPKKDLIEAVIQVAQEAGHEVTSWTKYLFAVNGYFGHREALNTLWDQFEAATVGTDSAVAHLWENRTVEAEGKPGSRRTRPEAEKVREAVWTSAIVAFARAGSTARARELFDRMVATTAYCQESGETADYARAPAATPKTFSELIKALAAEGDPDVALRQYTELASSPVLARMERGSISKEAVISVIDALVAKQPVSSPLNPSVALDAARLLFGEYPGVPAPGSQISSDWPVVRRAYTLLVATVAQNRNLSEAERLELLSFAGRCIETGWVKIDPEITAEHAMGLIELGHGHLAPAVISTPRPATWYRLQNRAQAAAERVATCQAKQALRIRLELAEVWAGQSVKMSSVVAETIVDQYASERANKAPGTVLVPRVEEGSEVEPKADNRFWFTLIEAFATLPNQRVRDGELDAVLVQLMEDLAVVYPVGGENSLVKAKGNAKVERLVGLLAWRFGVERAVALLEPVYGDAARAMVTPPEPEPASPATTAESPSTGTDSAPDSESTDASSVPPKDPKLIIQPTATHSIERFMAHNPTVTPLQAYEILQDGIRRGGSVPRISTILQLMDHLARAREEEKVRELYDLANVMLRTLVPPAGQAQAWYQISNAMLGACCHLGHLEEAGMHRAGIVEAGFAPSADAYATMIASSKDTTDDALVARELWDEAMAMGVKPHLFMYNTMISKLGKARKAEMALELFARLKTETRPSSVTYGAVINACCKVGDALSAETLFEEMTASRNFRPRVPPYNTMMQFYLNTQPNRERLLHYYQALLHARVPPSAHTYKLLLDAYGTLAPVDFSAMEQTFQQLVANRKVSVQGTHYASLISAYGANPETREKARHVFESVPLKKGDVVLKDAVVWESWLGVLANAGDVAGMESAHAEMLASRHIQPTAYVLNVLITGYAAAGQMDKARAVFEPMGDSVAGVAAPNNHPALLTSSGHAKPTTTTVGGEGESDVVYREPSTYETMIRAEVQHGTREKAEEVLKRMEERGYPPAVYMRGVAVLAGESVTPVYRGG